VLYFRTAEEFADELINGILLNTEHPILVPESNQALCEVMANGGHRPRLALLPAGPRKFRIPKKEIDEGEKVEFWLQSKGHSDVMTFLLQLNIAMFPNTAAPLSSKLNPESDALPSVVAGLQKILARLTTFIDDAPPDPGPRRFGNISFRHWHTLVEKSVVSLLSDNLPFPVISYPTTEDSPATVVNELSAIFLGSFGSSERLDYGTGHELSFLAFMAGIWKLHGFESIGEDAERLIVLGVFLPYVNAQAGMEYVLTQNRYFALIRKLILTYNLEPAGSHGVWGLDDHSFLPYIFGSAQLSPQVSSDAVSVPQEGSAKGAPKPGTVAVKTTVDDWRDMNMYFGAIGFINDVKKGAFWEHSPMLYDISGVKAGWAKINKVSI
jgi:serine/threonine-protein phosphatase 2A activator